MVLKNRYCADSRLIKPNDSYIVLNHHNNNYIKQAIDNGACEIIVDDSISLNNLAKIKITKINNLIKNLPDLLNNHYGNISKKLKIMGVTGTNGKSSICYLLGDILKNLNTPCGILGTLGNGIYGDLTQSPLTTLDTCELHWQLYLISQKARFAAMEVSSHGLDQNRVAGVEFDTAVFTNLTQDHLDYHGTMENYGNAKLKLFLKNNKKNIINTDDKFSEIIKNKINNYIKYSNQNIKNLTLSQSGFACEFIGEWGSVSIKAPLLGEFNIKNLLAAFMVLFYWGFEPNQITQAIKKITPIPGRMEKIKNSIIDYAHTPDALEKALVTLRKHCRGKLWCIFGCGGDRDNAKRKIMGQIADRLADQIIITNDNPRTEAPESIAKMILSGIHKNNQLTVELDRALAIQSALRLAKPDDLVLIAGKGHEDYQIIGHTKQFFSDKKIVVDFYGVKSDTDN